MAFVTVKATVERVFFEGKGFALIEEYKTKDGETRVNRFTAWFDQAPNLKEQQTAVFTGILSTKLEEFEGRDGQKKQKVAVSINKAQLKSEFDGQGRAQEDFIKNEAKGWADPAADLGAPF